MRELEDAIAATILINLSDLRRKAFEIEYNDFSSPLAKDAMKLIRQNKGQAEIGLYLVEKYGLNAYEIFAGAAHFPTEIDELIDTFKTFSARNKLRDQLPMIEKAIIDGKSLDEIRKMLLDLEKITRNDNSQCDNMKKISQAVANDVMDIATKGDSSIQLPLVNDYISYLLGGEFIIIAGRPAMGKTALMLTMARRLASEGIPVGYISLEMTAKALTLRMTQNDCDFYVLKALKGLQPGSEEYVRILDALERIKKLPIYMSDKSMQTLTSILGLIEHVAKVNEVKVIFIDYLQLISAGDGSLSKNYEIAAISRALKLIALETNTIIVAGSQLSRKVEARENKRPYLSDLRDSGSIEQDADVVTFLYREGYYDEDADQELTEFIVAKQRNGVIGTQNLRFDLKHQWFTKE